MFILTLLTKVLCFSTKIVYNYNYSSEIKNNQVIHEETDSLRQSTSESMVNITVNGNKLIKPANYICNS